MTNAERQALLEALHHLECIPEPRTSEEYEPDIRYLAASTLIKAVLRLPANGVAYLGLGYSRELDSKAETEELIGRLKA